MEAVRKIPGPDHPITVSPATGRVTVTFAGKVNPQREEMHRILETIGRHGEATIAALARAWPENRRGLYVRSLLWLAKLGLVRITRG